MRAGRSSRKRRRAAIRVFVLGRIDGGFAGGARDVPGFVIGREYSAQDLARSSTRCVGLMPSIWEEATAMPV